MKQRYERESTLSLILITLSRWFTVNWRFLIYRSAEFRIWLRNAKLVLFAQIKIINKKRKREKKNEHFFQQIDSIAPGTVSASNLRWLSSFVRQRRLTITELETAEELGESSSSSVAFLLKKKKSKY